METFIAMGKHDSSCAYTQSFHWKRSPECVFSKPGVKVVVCGRVLLGPSVSPLNFNLKKLLLIFSLLIKITHFKEKYPEVWMNRK